MNKLSRIALYTLLPMAASAASPVDWYDVTPESRPYVRWWWHGSAVDSIGLTYNLEEFARQGIGGVEITPIYGVKGNEANDIPYLSPRWMDMLGHLTDEAARLGLQIDMNNGTGWPFGGPEVTTDESARRHFTESWTVAPGKSLKEKIIPTQDKQRGVATVERVMAVSGDKRIDITRRLRKDGTLKWRAPKTGEWTVYALFCGRTFQKVKRAAPGGEGYVVNHYDSVAIKKYLDRFDRAFAGREKCYPTSFFNDSYEVYGSDWTEKLLDEFERENGYRLEAYLPEFEGEGGDTELRSRLLSDYRRTLARMLYDNFTRVWTDWAHSKGATIRNQSHGSPANILDLYAVVDIPECESFGRTDFKIPGLYFSGPSRPSDSAPSVLKFASSAAHLAGKPLVSAETLTWLTEHFHTSLARCKPEIDQMLASGVNHIYFHGAPYSPKGAEFPGRLFYASINMSPTSAMWEDSKGLFDYISRAQTFLSQGNPDNDLLLFFPYDDILHRQGGNPYLMFDIHKMQQRMPDIKETLDNIVRAGYDVDYLSDSLLTNLSVIPGGKLLSRGGNPYKAVIVPNVKFMQPQTLERLIRLAESGANVIFIGSVPADVPGMGHYNERLNRLNELRAALPSNIKVAANLDEALAMTGASPEPLRKGGLSVIRRGNEAGGHNYFIANLLGDTIDGFEPLAVAGRSAILFNPLTGEKGLAESRVSADGNLEVRLQLRPGESVMVKTFPDEVSDTPYAYTDHEGGPVSLDRGWSLSFVKSTPEILGTFPIDSLISWTELPLKEAQVNSGTGRYTVTFTLPELTDTPSDWRLDLGDVRESARVRVNGTDAGTVWAVPFSVNIGSLLMPGENTLDIDVTNLDANRIRDYEMRGVEWRKFKDANIASVTNAKSFSFADWPVTPSGLNSKVTLTPIYR